MYILEYTNCNLPMSNLNLKENITNCMNSLSLKSLFHMPGTRKKYHMIHCMHAGL